MVSDTTYNDLSNNDDSNSISNDVSMVLKGPLVLPGAATASETAKKAAVGPRACSGYSTTTSTETTTKTENSLSSSGWNIGIQETKGIRTIDNEGSSAIPKTTATVIKPCNEGVKDVSKYSGVIHTQNTNSVKEEDDQQTESEHQHSIIKHGQDQQQSHSDKHGHLSTIMRDKCHFKNNGAGAGSDRCDLNDTPDDRNLVHGRAETERVTSPGRWNGKGANEWGSSPQGCDKCKVHSKSGRTNLDNLVVDVAAGHQVGRVNNNVEAMSSSSVQPLTTSTSGVLAPITPIHQHHQVQSSSFPTGSAVSISSETSCTTVDHQHQKMTRDEIGNDLTREAKTRNCKDSESDQQQHSANRQGQDMDFKEIRYAEN
ncbi:hypothetical protein HDU76_009557, partial [Blyttiomyces sp. JEL0837]